MSESVILCEGYHDRAFWKGWLESLGCVDPGKPKEGMSGRMPVLDPSSRTVSSGHFGYRSKSEKFNRIVPCHGKDNVLREARKHLDEREVSKLVRLVVNRDADTLVNDETSFQINDLLREVHRIDGQAELNADGDIAMDNAQRFVSLVRWETPDAPGSGLPSHQSLERLVCAAMIAAYPDRQAAVQPWLDSRTNPPDESPKDYAWSYMAGWYADAGCERFYSSLWEDAAVVTELKSRLCKIGAWRIAATLAE
jgi:hypothetical protein